MPTHASPSQRQAINAAVSLGPGQVLCGNAYAGTGKTTTAVMIAEELTARRMPILYLCFNKAMADEAATRFPSSVKCSTAHSLAYRYVGHAYRAKLQDAVRPADLARLLKIERDVAAILCQVMNAFVASAVSSVTLDHVPAGIAAAHRNRYVEMGTRVWREMVNENTAMPITHDGYLKLFVQNLPDLPYDLVILDEAQDLNPILLTLAEKLLSAGKRVVFIGDTHQSIYGFRLAVDAMRHAAETATMTFSLTESYRFGQRIADMASALLNKHKGDPVRLVGHGPKPGARAHAIISRTNSTLLASAAKHATLGQRMHFAGTTDRSRWSPYAPYRFQDILDAHALFIGRPDQRKGTLLAEFDSFDHLLYGALSAGSNDGRDPELAPIAEFVREYGTETPSILRRIESASAGPDATDLHFSTAHRSKGKEWATVEITDGFAPLDDPEKLKKFRESRTGREYTEEINLLYVAVTRAMRSASVPKSSSLFFAQATGPAKATA